MLFFNADRETALLFYGVLRRYCDEEFWKGTIVRRKLKIPNDVICKFEQEFSHNYNEEKYSILDYWKRAHLLGENSV